MTTKSILSHCLCLTLMSCCTIDAKPQLVPVDSKGTGQSSPGFQKLFDGKTLNGWEVLPGGEWKVENGIIVGLLDKTEKRHGMLLSKKTYTDFIVKLKYKSLKGNSGFYFRAGRDEGHLSVKGFQAEIDEGGEDV